jgi:hypothetical protein
VLHFLVTAIKQMPSQGANLLHQTSASQLKLIGFDLSKWKKW